MVPPQLLHLCVDSPRGKVDLHNRPAAQPDVGGTNGAAVLGSKQCWPVLPPTLSNSTAAAKSSSSESMGKGGKAGKADKVVMSVGIEISRSKCELSELGRGER